MNIDKLEDIFAERYKELADEAKDDEFFVNWCDKHKVVIMHAEWVREVFNDANKDMVCIFHPIEFDRSTEQQLSNWLLVPRKLADKTLVLGYLP